jgi:hypothetical protein
MNRKLLWVGLAALVIVVGSVVGVLNAWEHQQLGPHQIRRQLVFGQVQLLRDGKWESSFIVDPRAPLLSAEDVRRVTISDIHWGEAGLLGAIANVAPGKPLNGRLVFVIEIQETRDGKRIRDRGIRETIAWQGGTKVPIVLSTGLFKPIQKQKTTVHTETID